MRNLVLHSVMILAILAGNTASAAETFACSPAVVKTENKNIILPGPNDPKETKIYFFNNISQESLWLDHPVPHASASAGWSSYLRPSNWSAILVNRKDFVINCAVIKPGKVDYKDCGKAITICSPKTSTLGSKRKGSYWIVEDKSWDDFVKSFTSRAANKKS